MKFVIDMNLSKDWIPYLEGLGHEAVHWSHVADADADDEEIMIWARAHDHVILTNDLDFGTLLITSGVSKPSVIQLRTEITLSKHVGPLVARAIEQSEAGLTNGTLLTIEEGRLRARPLDVDSTEV